MDVKQRVEDLLALADMRLAASDAEGFLVLRRGSHMALVRWADDQHEGVQTEVLVPPALWECAELLERAGLTVESQYSVDHVHELVVTAGDSGMTHERERAPSPVDLPISGPARWEDASPDDPRLRVTEGE
jgi:hypothetical protein